MFFLLTNIPEEFHQEPIGRERPDLLKIHPSHGHDMTIHNGISRIGFMAGGKLARWIDEEIADTILAKSIGFITENKDNPFFLFYSLHQPHVPRTPHPRFEGKSGMGPRGDAILEADWCIGQLLNTLDSLGIADNTIVMLSSDNGPVLDDGYQDKAFELVGNHTPAGPLRGGKYSLFDAGTRIPFMIRWPGTIEPGISNAVVCQVDYMASLAEIVGTVSWGVDSQDLSEAFLGKSDTGRENLVLEATGRLGIRQGDWIMLPPHNGALVVNEWVRNETGNSIEYQLYNVKEDIGQQKNLAANYPEKVEEMNSVLLELSDRNN